MIDHDHDDGLVHSHDWAREKPRPARAGLIIPSAWDDHDDGLVHGHAWAYEPAK